MGISVWKGMYVCVCIPFSVLPPLFLAAVGSLTLAAKDLSIWSEHIKAAEDQMLKTDFLAYISPWRYQSHTCSSLFIKAIALLILFIILLLGNSGAAKLISSSQPPFGPLDLLQFRQHPAIFLPEELGLSHRCEKQMEIYLLQKNVLAFSKNKDS